VQNKKSLQSFDAKTFKIEDVTLDT